MASFASETVSGFVESLGAETPAPGGGAAAAVACASAAALVRMAAAFTLAHAELAAVHPRMRKLGRRAAQIAPEALALADSDAEAYGRVIAAHRLPKDDPARAERIAAALSGAADVPMAIVAAGAEVAAMGAELHAGGNPNLRGDAVTATVLAEAGARAAAALVELNLEGAPDDPRRARAAELSEAAHRARERVLGTA